jgi:tetratricopeptide (TPR) repeat protein
MLTEVRMGSAHYRRGLLTIGAFVLGLFAFSTPALAQTGQVKGKVVDANNKPIEGAQIVIEMTEGMTRKYETKTDRRGEFVQVGLQPGQYRITASKDGMSQSFDQRIRLGQSEVNFTLKPGMVAGATEEDRKKAEEKLAAVKGAFEQGVTLSNENKPDEAIAKFQEVLAAAPKCVECYNNIGTNYTRKQDYPKAEEAFKKALEVNPQSADAYNGLATVYNAQKQFDKAAEASAQAQKLAGEAGGAAGTAGGGNASTVYNQGVIAWNAGKVPEAKKLFEQAVQLDPKLADAHYWLGMATLNEGKMPEAAKYFEEYLKLQPSGQYAEQAKSILTQIKK